MKGEKGKRVRLKEGGRGAVAMTQTKKNTHTSMLFVKIKQIDLARYSTFDANIFAPRDAPAVGRSDKAGILFSSPPLPLVSQP